MRLNRTDKAREELQSQRRTLSIRQRQILFLADGQRTQADIAALIGSQHAPLLQQLLDDGYLAAPAAIRPPQRSDALRREPPAVITPVPVPTRPQNAPAPMDAAEDHEPEEDRQNSRLDSRLLADWVGPEALLTDEQREARAQEAERKALVRARYYLQDIHDRLFPANPLGLREQLFLARDGEAIRRCAAVLLGALREQASSDRADLIHSQVVQIWPGFAQEAPIGAAA